MNKKESRKYFIPLCVVLSLLILLGGIWQQTCEKKAHIMPEAEKADISRLLQKTSLSAEDYQILFAQTGLSKTAVDKLIKSGESEKLYTIQELFFREPEICCEKNSLISREEYVTDSQGRPEKGMLLADIENGDILYTPNSHVAGWRNGHAAMVVDAEEGLILEAQVLGKNSCFTSAKRWENYPAFAVLRLKDADMQQRSEIAERAAETLQGIPYRLSADTFGKGTHCSHLVWQAYKAFGWDIDSDGGLIVTPHDILTSPLLETIQLYGIERAL